ncbi:MAG: EAL domain-containing protein [Sedimenticola sp.]|nr:EAL domain-containing protein [Sedimenticola sp.]
MKSLDQQITSFVKQPIGRLLLLGLLFWTALVGYSLDWNITNLQKEKNQLAISEARANWNKDQAFRHWASKHGGVYVKPNERTPPNPYLSHLKDRDIITGSGEKLTLMNPAYMLRQITSEFEDSYGVKGKITGKITLNPINKADEWEHYALDQFESSMLTEIVELATIDGQPFMRYMKPMYMTKGCEKCHGFLGFKEGDLRGGVSVSIPMTHYLEAAKETINTMVITHSAVWVIGILGLFGFGVYASLRQTEQVSLLEKLEHSALYDSLTTLPNRFLFDDRLSVVMAKQSRDKKRQYAVCFVDLDRFKNLNDSYGHSIGDQLLKEMALRFKAILRPSDTVARMGGDEFTFLIDNVSNPEEVLLITNRILDSVKEPFVLAGYQIQIDASIGICFGHSKYKQSEDILRDADIAMYRAKALGKGRVDIFEPEMHAKVEKTTRIEHDLHSVLSRNELSIHYQPIIDIESMTIKGFEALLRWNHPEFGNIPPDEFIQIAESSDVIHQIGGWVLLTACKQVASWNSSLDPQGDFFVSVNLSARQVSHSKIIHVVRDILESIGFAPEKLHCEVTETLLITDQETTQKNMAGLKALGVNLSADDFGKGYSSLTYLQNYCFDIMKIDKEFVHSMEPEGKGKRLVSSLVKLARDFDLSVIAEGVETQKQLDVLSKLGCHYAQGYYLCPPQSAADIQVLFNAGAHRSFDSLHAHNPYLKKSA